MSERPNVVLVYPLPTPEVEADLRARSNVVDPVSEGPDDLAAALAGADGVILRGPAQLTAALIDVAPRLRVIGAQGSGTDNIDVAAATARGIPVVHGAGVAPQPVAEFVIGAMVAAHRRTLAMHQAVTAGDLEWAERLVRHQGTQLTGTTLGVIGFGFIGREVARMAQAAFSVDVLVFDPYLPEGADLAGAARTDDLGELLDRSLTVTVHVPLSDDTRGLLGRDELRRIGSNGVLIDTARGGVVDEAAIVAALEAGELAAAVVDVFDPEPPTPEQLRRLAAVPNLQLSPHVAGVTDQGLRTLSRHVVDQVLGVLAGRPPTRVVNPEVLAAPTAATP